MSPEILFLSGKFSSSAESRVIIIQAGTLTSLTFDLAGDNPATAITSALLNDNTRKAPDVPLSEVSKGKGEKEPKIVSMNNLFAVHESSASDVSKQLIRNFDIKYTQVLLKTVLAYKPSKRCEKITRVQTKSLLGC